MPRPIISSRQRDAAVLLLSMLAVYALIWSFTSRSLFETSTYNSYALQASRWLQGHLDLGQNYSYLEIAQYQGRYFVSFPPIPSVLLLPFCALFGATPPDTLISVVVGLIGGLYALKMAWLAGRKGRAAVFWALFVTVGSNFLHIGYSADVWYFAQTCSFTFTMAALYYSVTDDIRSGWLPCFLLALAFGCRPLQIIYLPLILLLLWQKLSRNGLTLRTALGRYWWWILPPLLVGCALMGLNLARFGNPFQFGHDFLPEFAIEKENGQFSLAYLRDNWKLLWQLPPLRDGVVQFPLFNGCAFWLFSPIFLVFVCYGLKHWRTVYKTPAVPLTVILVLLHLVALCCHATMGGWQFGNRYPVDALPAVYASLMLLLRKDQSDGTLFTQPLFFWGLGLNLTGTIALLNQWLA